MRSGLPAAARWRLAATVLATGVLGFLVAGLLGAQAESPCRTDESHRTLDFLLGDWRLVAGGDDIGTSKVESLEGGCLIRETWTFDDGRSGRTWSVFDRAAKVWRRVAVWNDGSVARSAGTVDGRDVVFEGERVSAGGTASAWQERLRPSGDEVDRLVGTSQGAVTLERRYVPAGATGARPRAAAAPRTNSRQASPPQADEPVVAASSAGTAEDAAPADQASPAAPSAGEVTPSSARAVDARLIERVAMESPMVLRLPLGPVENLREGYAWITRDTAPYLCEGVTIRSIRVERGVRRRKVELTVDLRLHTERVSRPVELVVELHSAGASEGSEPVASGSAAGLVGRVVPEQIEHGEVTIDVMLAMDQALFAELVAGEERPVLAVSLTVGE